MPQKYENAAGADKQFQNSFASQVKQALEHFTDAEWLGINSPLAAPYILGHRLDHFPTGETVLERGLALQNVLRSGAEQLSEEVLRQVLLHGFFARDGKRNLDSVALHMDLSSRTFFRYLSKAVEELADILSRTLLPTLRPESLIYKTMIGRAEILQACRHALHAKQSVSLIGASGTGKTTLAAAIAQVWEEGVAHFALSQTQRSARDIVTPHVFLFTLRPGLNDQFASLVFALGYFLRVNGIANTWRQLVADKGVIQPERILGLIRHDLAQPQSAALLLCIDEIDTLQVEMPEHAQIIHLIEELRTQVPLLLIGERMLIQTDHHHLLTGFTLTETETLLHEAGITNLPSVALQQLWMSTRGNPALLTLFIALVHSGDDREAVLHDLNRAPSLEALFNRMWRRLSEAERLLLMRLAVFRNASPQDAWREQQPVLEQLRQRELIEWDERGGVRLPSHLHKFVYERIPIERRPLFHLQAAQIRETRGEYVAALHHYWEGGQPAMMVWVWYTHRSLEIARGQGASALAVLARIEATDLPEPSDRNVLHEARAELLKLAGKVEAAQAELQGVTESTSDLFRAQLLNRQGELYEMQGQIEQALVSYRASLDTLLGTRELREVTLHTKLSFLQLYRLHNIEQARKEALLARMKAEAFHGLVEEMSGNYTLARTLYESSLNLAELSGGDLAVLSRVYTYLSSLTIRQGEIDTGISLIEKAMDCDRRRGDVVSPLYDLMNLAYAYTLVGRYEEAYQQATNGLYLAESMQHSYLIAGLAAAVGEACFYLNRFHEAEQYAMQSLHTEEEFFRASALVLLGMVRQAQGQPNSAVTLMEEAITSAQNLEDKHTEAYAWRELGKVQHANHQTEAAQQAYAKAREIYTALNLPKEIAELNKISATLVG